MKYNKVHFTTRVFGDYPFLGVSSPVTVEKGLNKSRDFGKGIKVLDSTKEFGKRSQRGLNKVSLPPTHGQDLSSADV